ERTGGRASRSARRGGDGPRPGCATEATRVSCSLLAAEGRLHWLHRFRWRVLGAPPLQGPSKQNLLFSGRTHMPESLQHKLDRVRRPRVQITYDVEIGGAMKKVELPFVVGVLADLSGQPKEALRPLKERKAVFIDRDNFNDVLAKAGVRLAVRVPNKLTDPNSKLAVELNFKSMDDF